MKVSPPLKGVQFSQKSPKSITPTTKKHSSNFPILQSQKTTQRIYTNLYDKSSQVMEQKTKKSKDVESNLHYSIKKQEKKEKKENQQNHLIVEIQNLRAEIQTLRRNHKEQIQFYLNEELNMAVNVQKLLVSKQYRRLFTFIEHQIFEMRKRMEEFSALDLESTQNILPTKSLLLNATLEQDIQLKSLTDHFQDNVQQIGIENVAILPQIKKLMSETQLSAKRLSWYFSKVPFDIPSKQICNSLATKIVNDLGCNTGCQVMEMIVNKTKTQSQTIQNQSDSDSSISKIIQRHSLCIL